MESVATTTLNGLGAPKDPQADTLFDQSVLPRANLPQESIEDMSIIQGPGNQTGFIDATEMDLFGEQIDDNRGQPAPPQPAQAAQMQQQ